VDAHSVVLLFALRRRLGFFGLFIPSRLATPSGLCPELFDCRSFGGGGRLLFGAETISKLVFGLRPSMDDFFDNWTVQVRKGLLELCILNALADEERYGYDLVKGLVGVPGLGVTEGTIYPLLSRLRVANLISSRLEESSAGPARKYYSLTKEGRKVMETMNDYMGELNRSVTRLRKKGA
jgi:PadR family transcriptional regulator PadR